jgi:hypothetical protein
MSSEGETYGVRRGEFLFRCDDGAGASGSVERGFALNDGLTRTGGATAGTATNFGDGVPFFSHDGGDL